MSLRLWGNHIAGPVLAVIAIFFVIASAFVNGDSTLAARMVKWSAWITGIATVILMFRAQYDTWCMTDEDLAKERAINEAAPQIHINAQEAIPNGSISTGLTDLFVYLDLQLKEPSYVTLQDFTISFEQGTQSSPEFSCVADLSEWKLMKRDRPPESCKDMVRELSVRGDPVRGWLHFRFPAGIPEGSMSSSIALLRIKGIHGTCPYRFQVFTLPDPVGRGVMRRMDK